MDNKKRLTEALKRHQLLVEYNFYVPKGMDEQDAPTEEAPTDAPTGEEGAAPEIPTPEETPGAPAPTEPTPELPTPDAGLGGGDEGEVEVDITDLVNSTNDTKDKIDGTNELLNNILSKFDELESKISAFDQVLSRIDGIEKDIEKRLPTPVEKLEMRSMDSFPYSVKLTDYWKDESEETEEQGNTEKEYVLTPEEVKKDYNPNDIKNTFD